MNVEQFSFQNRHDLKIVGEIRHPENAKGLAFVQHGLTSARNRPHIKLLADLFCAHGYTAISFDATNSFGESSGQLRNVTQTSYIEDFEDVIAFIKEKPFYQEPFILAGHSMGGFSTLYLTLKYPEKIKAAAPLSSIISGKLRVEAYERFQPEELRDWKEKGFQERSDRLNPGVKDILPWALMEDWLTYDVLEDASRITCPVFLAVGENDFSTPLYQQEMLLEKLAGSKELAIITNCEHTFREQHELSQLETAFSKWLAAL